MTEPEVIAELRRLIEAVGDQSAWAKQNGLSPAYVCDVLLGRRAPGKSILKAMGLKKVVRYEREGP